MTSSGVTSQSIVINSVLCVCRCVQSYHETSGDIWLKDVIKGALGENAAFKGKDLRQVAHTVLVMPATAYCQRGLGVVVLCFVLFRTRRIKDGVHLDGCTVIRRIAGMNDGSGVTLRLRQRKGP